ncbi:MAG TPA: hypothetical protein VEU47_02135 [Candidatus Cybelea sp.]|nr:hypothetical protein [Candidatus Cybelea sp.]
MSLPPRSRASARTAAGGPAPRAGGARAASGSARPPGGGAPPPRKGAIGKRPPPAQHVSVFGALLVAMTGAAVLGLSPPSFMIVATGMAPSLISYFFETGGARRPLPCMVALNIAGVAPALNMLWSKGATVSAAYALLRDPYIWLLMYGAAGLAYGLIWAAPRVMQAIIDANAQSRRTQYVAVQAKLVADWGEAVTSEPGRLAQEPAPDGMAQAAPAPASPAPKV